MPAATDYRLRCCFETSLIPCLHSPQPRPRVTTPPAAAGSASVLAAPPLSAPHPGSRDPARTESSKPRSSLRLPRMPVGPTDNPAPQILSVHHICGEG